MVPELRRTIQPWNDWLAYRALLAVLGEFSPEVVHTHSAKGGFLGRLAAWKLGVPAVVHTVHGAPFHPYQNFFARTFFQWCERYAARRCHALVSVADAMTDQLVAAGVAPRDKFTTVYSGMDVEPFLRANETRPATRARLGLAPEHIVVGKIARLFHLKGHEYLIAAARQVVADSPDIRFLLIGDGILRSSLERQIADAGLRDHFVFAGLVAPEEIPSLIGAMDILVHVSLREGLARALPQALIAGKPVVSYDIDGAREVVLPGQTGFLVPPRSVEPLADAIRKLVVDPSLRERLGRNGQARFADVFRHETMTSQLRAVYQRELSRL
jgi:glycosyltransferase involved in cell wall biosynthesis